MQTQTLGKLQLQAAVEPILSFRRLRKGEIAETQFSHITALSWQRPSLFFLFFSGFLSNLVRESRLTGGRRSRKCQQSEHYCRTVTAFLRFVHLAQPGAVLQLGHLSRSLQKRETAKRANKSELQVVRGALPQGGLVSSDTDK